MLEDDMGYKHLGYGNAVLQYVYKYSSEHTSNLSQKDKVRSKEIYLFK